MAASKSSSMDAVKKLIAMCTQSGFGKVFEKLQLICAEKGVCVAEFKIDDDHKNFRGNLHGGLTATLMACMSTYALVSENPETPGVSVNLNVTYVKSARPGDLLVITSTTTKRGEHFGYVDVVMKDKCSGGIVATATMTKFLSHT